MEQLRKDGFLLAPEVMHSTAGDTILIEGERPFGLYRFVESDPPFDWTKGGWTMEHARTAGRLLAEFHVAVHRAVNSMPVGNVQAAQIDPLSQKATAEWGRAVLQRASGMFPDDVMIGLGNFDDVLRTAFKLSEQRYRRYWVHGDFHPANILFKGEQAVALLDFEYVRHDSRSFDVGYAIMTFSFEHMNPDYGLAVLREYNAASQTDPMDMTEVQPFIRLSAWLSGVWLIEQCQKGAAGHDEVLAPLRKCIAILSASDY
jgi:Ser/Thr protein kinase RdoA (MazF antagonist)